MNIIELDYCPNNATIDEMCELLQSLKKSKQVALTRDNELLIQELHAVGNTLMNLMEDGPYVET